MPDVNRSTSIFGVLLICGVAIAVMLPELLVGISYTDSFRYNHVWTAQFTDAFANGTLYPRWLPDSWAGFGSPTFYFYPPFFFWTVAAVQWLSGGLITASTAATMAWGIILSGSGFAMRGWLRGYVPHKAALGGAVAYMLAPYHLYDIYCRGAWAEACGYLFLPLILRGIDGLSAPRPERGVFLLGVGYAGFLLSHLPLALLASVIVIPAYVFWRAASAPHPAKTVMLAIVGGVIGIATSAIYWLPLVGLTHFVSFEALSGAYFQPDRWFFSRYAEWSNGIRMAAIVVVTIAGPLLALSGARSARSREGWFWFVIATAGFVFVSGLLPFLWQLPLLAQVQFPFRALPIVELATIAALAMGAPRLRDPLVVAGGLPLIMGATLMALVAAEMLKASARQGMTDSKMVMQSMADAPEYLPRGFPTGVDEQGRPDPSRVVLPPLPLVWAEDSRVRLRAQESTAADRALTIVSDAPQSSTLVARRFYFPHWRVVDEHGNPVPVFASPKDRLAAWRIKAGNSVYRLSSGRVPNERAGQWLTFAGSIMLGLLSLKTCLRSRTRKAPDD